MKASFAFDLFGIDLGGGEFGPVWSETLKLDDIEFGALFNDTFNLEGFNTVDPGKYVLTLDQVDFTGGGVNSSWSNAGNWSTGSIPTGGDVLITASDSPRKSVDMDVDATVNNLFISNDASLLIFSDKTLTVEGDTILNENLITVNDAKILLQDNQATTITGGGQILLAGDDAQILFKDSSAGELGTSSLGTVHNRKITLIDSEIRGRGEIIGAGFELHGDAKITASSSSQELELDVERFGDIVSGAPGGGTLQATNGGTLIVNLRPDDADPSGGTARLGNHAITTDFDNAGTPNALTIGNTALMKVFAADGSQVLLQQGFDATLGTVQARGIHFDTDGSGVITFSDDVDFVSVLNTGLLDLDSSRFSANSSTWTDSVNDGTIRVLQSGGGRRTSITEAEFEGHGSVFLRTQNAIPGTETTIGGGSLPTIINEQQHSIIGAGIVGVTEDVINRGTIAGDSDWGAKLTVNNLKNEGGTLAAINGSQVELTGNTANANNGVEGTFQANDGSQITVRDDAGHQFAGLSDTGLLKLAGGTYIVGSTTDNLGLGSFGDIHFVTDNTSTTFDNRATISLRGAAVLPASGDPELGWRIRFGALNGATKGLHEFDEFINNGGGRLEVLSPEITPVYEFDTAKLENLGTVFLDNAKVGQINNLATGEVQGSGTAEFQAVLGEVLNQGAIRAIKTENNDRLVVTGGTTFRNLGTVEARDAFLVLENMTLSGDGFSGTTLGEGTWIVDGSEDQAEINVKLPSGSTGIDRIDTDVTLKGVNARFTISETGSPNTSISAQVNQIGSNGKLRLIDHTITFIDQPGTNEFTVDGLLELEDGDLSTSENQLTINAFNGTGGVRGNGSIHTFLGTIVNNHIISAEGGVLELKSDVQQSSNARTQALDKGSAIRLSGNELKGGELFTAAGAGLVGYGEVTDVKIDNAGLIGATGGILELGLLSSLSDNVNTGEITAQSNGVIQIKPGTESAFRYRLDNTGGLISTISESDPATTARVEIFQDAYIVGGDLFISGTNATFNGVGTLNGVNVRTEIGATVTSNRGGTLLFDGENTATATFVGSTVSATDGSRLNLYNYSNINAFGTTLVADGVGSLIDIRNTDLNGGLLKTLNSGSVTVTGNSTFTDTQNRGSLTVSQAGTLSINEVFDNSGGVTTIFGNSTLQLATDNTGSASFLGGDLVNNSGGLVVASGDSKMLGVQFSNNGTTRVNAGATLTVDQWDDPGTGLTQSGLLTNGGTFEIQGDMVVKNQEMINQRTVTVAAGGSLDVQTYRQSVFSDASTVLHGTMTANDFYMESGSLIGSGNLTGNLIHTGGTISPGSSPGTLTVGGGYELVAQEDTAPSLHLEIASLTDFDRLVALGGDITLAGVVIIEFLDEESIGELLTEGEPVTFDLFDVAEGFSIDTQFTVFEFTGALEAKNVDFDPVSGGLSFTAVPEPTTLTFILSGFAVFCRRRR